MHICHNCKYAIKTVFSAKCPWIRSVGQIKELCQLLIQYCQENDSTQGYSFRNHTLAWDPLTWRSLRSHKYTWIKIILRWAMSEWWQCVFIFQTGAAEWRKADLSSQAAATESLDLTLDKVNTWAHTHTHAHTHALTGLSRPPPCPSAGDHTPRPHRVWEQPESLSRNTAHELSLWPPPSLSASAGSARHLTHKTKKCVFGEKGGKGKKWNPKLFSFDWGKLSAGNPEKHDLIMLMNPNKLRK